MDAASSVLQEVARDYCRRWRVGLSVTDPAGISLRVFRAAFWGGDRYELVRRLAIEETLRWGDPAVQPGPGETVLWAVPLMHNALLTGGLVAGIAESKLFRRGASTPVIDVRAACTDLRRLAELHNLTNAALLEARRLEYQREQVRAEATHAHKGSSFSNMRSMYLLDEPSLVAAVRRGDRKEAR